MNVPTAWGEQAQTAGRRRHPTPPPAVRRGPGRRRVRPPRLLVLALLLVWTPQAAFGHEGPPYPIHMDRPVGPWTVSVWTDPDIGIGTFYVVLEPIGDRELVTPWSVRVAVRPVSGRLPETVYEAEPQRVRRGARYLAEVEFDQGELWDVRIVLEGPGGGGELTSRVEATPDGTIGPIGLVIYSLPFALIAGLWWRAVVARRRMTEEARAQAKTPVPRGNAESVGPGRPYAMHTKPEPAVPEYVEPIAPDDPDPENAEGLQADDGASDRAIRALVERNPDQCTIAEYTHIRDTIRERAPGRVLVFGVGRDTPLWMDANRGGTTVFLENLPRWVEHTRREVPDAEVLHVEYDTRRFQWRWLLKRPERLMMDLPADVLDTPWDVVFVDAPKGKSWRSPGRMKSIYTASVLAKPGEGHVLVHDCNRKVERTYCDVHLADAELVAAVDDLRHYRMA